jgi:ribonuclease HI
MDWVKVNTDGSFKSGDRAGIGGVFRDHSGVAIGAFASRSYFASSIAAEILAVIEAIRIAWVRDWHNVWLETDSAFVVHVLNSTTMVVPWSLQVEWENCLWQISQMSFFVSHIYREGNRIADVLANHGAENDAYYWWPTVPSIAQAFHAHDQTMMASYRFK